MDVKTAELQDTRHRFLELSRECNDRRRREAQLEYQVHQLQRKIRTFGVVRVYYIIQIY